MARIAVLLLLALRSRARSRARAAMFDDEEARKPIAATNARLDAACRSTLDARMATLEQQ